jgi:hypothetical protein
MSHPPKVFSICLLEVYRGFCCFSDTFVLQNRLFARVAFPPPSSSIRLLQRHGTASSKRHELNWTTRPGSTAGTVVVVGRTTTYCTNVAASVSIGVGTKRQRRIPEQWRQCRGRCRYYGYVDLYLRQQEDLSWRQKE